MESRNSLLILVQPCEIQVRWRTIVQRLTHGLVINHKSVMHEINAQRRLNRNLRPLRQGSWAVLFDQRHQLRPRHHPIELIQKFQMLVRLSVQTKPTVVCFLVGMMPIQALP